MPFSYEQIQSITRTYINGGIRTRDAYAFRYAVRLIRKYGLSFDWRLFLRV